MLLGHRTSFASYRDLAPARGSSDHRSVNGGWKSRGDRPPHLGDLLTVQVVSCLCEALQTERRADHNEEKWDTK
jgi:hypothetical protein